MYKELRLKYKDITSGNDKRNYKVKKYYNEGEIKCKIKTSLSSKD